MNCSEFENELATLLSGELDGSVREPRLARLREHAAACSECSGWSDLVEWASLPVSERDPFDDPDREYWDTFDARLRERIAGDHSAGTADRRRAWIGLAAAALVGIVLIVPWVLRDREPSGVVPEAPITAQAELDAIFDAADPDAVREEVERIVGGIADRFSAPIEANSILGDGEGLIPPAGGMDGQNRRQLLEWLEAETKRLEGGSA